MIRRSTAVLVLVAASIAPIATAADLKSNIRAAAQMTVAPKLTSLFAKASDEVTVLADGTKIVDASFPHVMVMSVTATGDKISSCTTTEAAALNTMSKGAVRPTVVDGQKDR